MTKEVWEGGWDYDNPPVEGAFLTERGWELPLKGTDPADGLTELIVAMGAAGAVDDPALAAEANPVLVSFVEADPPYGQGDTLQVIVLFNEKVDVTGGATIVIDTTGGTGTFVATAAAQTDTNEVLFEAVIPSETGDLSIAAQTITGTIADTSDATPSDLVIPVDAVADAGIISIA